MAFSALSLLSSLNSSSLTIVSSNAFVSSGSGETLRDGPLRRRSLACHDDRTRLFGTTKPRSRKPSQSRPQRLRRARAGLFRGSLKNRDCQKWPVAGIGPAGNCRRELVIIASRARTQAANTEHFKGPCFNGVMCGFPFHEPTGCTDAYGSPGGGCRLHSAGFRGCCRFVIKTPLNNPVPA